MHWVKHALLEFLGSFLLAHLFALPALHNAGVSKNFVIGNPLSLYNSLEEGAIPPWAFALFAALGVFLIYSLLSSVAQRAVHLNPIVSTYTLIADGVRGYNKGGAGYAFLTLLGLWLFQAAGAFAGGAVVLAFAEDRYQDASMFLNGPAADGFQRRTSLVGEMVLGFLLLAIVVYALRMITYERVENKSASQTELTKTTMWSLGLATFYFVYIAFFWVFTKSTVDFIRGGAYCVYAEVSGVACTKFSSTGMLLYWIIFIAEAGACLASFVVYALCFSNSNASLEKPQNFLSDEAKYIQTLANKRNKKI